MSLLTSKTKHKLKKQLWGYIFILPAFVFFIVFLLYPLIDAVILSFSDYSMGEGQQNFIGIQNYISIFNDPVFLKVLLNTFIYVCIVVPVTVLLALLLSETVIHKMNRQQTFFRIAFYLPVVLSVVTISLVWSNMYSRAFGIFNYLIELMGGSGINWLGDPIIVKFSISLVIVTFTLGQPFVMYLAALGAIPEELSEAAYIDGATRWKRFWHVTFPLLKPVTLYVSVTTTIKAFQVFALVKLLTGGGPNYASDTVVSLIYKEAFNNYNISRAATMGVVLAAIIAVISIFQFRSLALNGGEK